MTNEQIDKASRIAQKHGDRATKAMSLADELQSIQEELSIPATARKALETMGPQAQKAAKLMSVRPEPIKSPWERSPVLPTTATFDNSDTERLMKEATEGIRARQREKQDRERRMVQALEAVQAEMVAAGKREARMQNRAEESERRSALMVKLTAASVAFGAIATVISVVGFLH